MGKPSFADTAAVERELGVAVLNVGFSSEPENSLIERDDPHFYCLRLYEHALRYTPLENHDVLELSCGCGGGAEFVSRFYHPHRLIGVDSNDACVERARQSVARDGVEFVHGEGEQLPFATSSFDVVLRIAVDGIERERDHLLAEVFRVLRPGGHFCYTDNWWADEDPTEDFASAGFEVLERREITDNVLRALKRDSARRAALCDAVPSRELRERYKDSAGVVGYRGYRLLEAGQVRYFSQRLRRPIPPG